MARTKSFPKDSLYHKVFVSGGVFARTDARAIKCYRWEWSNKDLLGTAVLSRDVAKGLARLCVKSALARLAAKHGLSADQVASIRDTFKARFTKEESANVLACGGENGVFFTKNAWTASIIAHEVAHWIDIREAIHLKERNERTGHGPKWLGWYVFLLVDVLGISITKLDESLGKAGLRYTTLE